MTPEQIDVLNGQEGLGVLVGPEYTSTVLVYDTGKAPFNNVAVRQANDLGINRELLVSDIFLGAATLGNSGWVHPDSPFFNPAVTTSYDPATAGEVLDTAGITDSDGDGVRELDGAPLEAEVLVYSSNALRMRIAELIAQQLGEIGFKLEVSALEAQAVDDLVWPGYDVSMGRNFDLAVWGWSAPTQADIGQMGALVSSDPVLGNINVTGFTIADADTLATDLRTQADPDARKQTAFALQELIAEQLLFVTLLYPDGAYGYSSAVYDGWAPITGQGPINKLSSIPADARP